MRCPITYRRDWSSPRQPADVSTTPWPSIPRDSTSPPSNAFSAFVSDFPQDRHREEALYRLADSYRALGHNDDALAAYTFQVQTYPEGPLRNSGELRRGAILFDSGKIADALVPLQFVADKGDGELQDIAKYLLGRGLIATGKEPKVSHSCRVSSINSHPENLPRQQRRPLRSWMIPNMITPQPCPTGKWR